MPKKKAPWIIDVKGSAKHGGEISILRADNEHGQRSYGWDGQDKLIIHSSDEPDDRVTKAVEFIWNETVSMAKCIAIALNDREKICRK